VDECEPLVVGGAAPGAPRGAQHGGGQWPAGRQRCHGQGLTLVHFSAQPEPFLTLHTPTYPLIPHNTCSMTNNQPLNAPPVPLKALTLSRKVDECKPLVIGVLTAVVSILAGGTLS